jgi:hypothetical protein
VLNLRVPIPEIAQTDHGAHPASYPMRRPTRGSFAESIKLAILLHVMPRSKASLLSAMRLAWYACAIETLLL